MAWVFVGMASSPTISHYHLLIGVLAFGAWWQFRRDRSLSGKMWLSIASGLGVSIGVMLILAVSPRAFPAGRPQINEEILLASIYMGGAIIGLAYVSYILNQAVGTTSGVTHEVALKYAWILFLAAVARALLLPISSYYSLMLPPVHGMHALTDYSPLPLPPETWGNRMAADATLVLIGGILLPGIAYAAWNATRFRHYRKASILLGVFCIVGVGTEILARWLTL